MSDRILLVEDDPSDEKLALRAFSRCEVPHEIVVARDGVEALVYLFDKPHPGSPPHAPPSAQPSPRLVLLDLKLPRVDGLDVLREIRRHDCTRLLPVVVLSASREEEDLCRSLSLGANAYVRKPLDFTQFVETARVVVAFWLKLNEPVPAYVGTGKGP
jgi:two-component system response regulator